MHSTEDKDVHGTYTNHAFTGFASDANGPFRCTFMLFG